MPDPAQFRKEGAQTGVLTPDPTERTLDQSRREIAMLKELIEVKLLGKDEVHQILKEYNAAIVGHVRTELDNLKELTTGQFSQRDLALTAAFAAQEKLAIAQQKANNDSAQRTEANTTKQLEAQGGSIKAVEKTLGENTNDLKERIQAAESRLSSRITTIEAGRQGSIGATATAIAVIVAILIFMGLVVDIAVHFK